jgi:hypothetical protein
MQGNEESFQFKTVCNAAMNRELRRYSKMSFEEFGVPESGDLRVGAPLDHPTVEM